MRVIGGKFRGRKLFSPEGSGVRPTTDRIKETLFNVLFSKGALGGGEVLDLFGGSGALGIEALSRGAEKAVFCDNDAASVRLIRANLAHVGAAVAEYELYAADCMLALKKCSGRKFRVIFADPPYAAGLYEGIIAGVVRYDLLEEGGVLVVESDAETTFPVAPFKADRRKCGNTALTFLTRTKEVFEP